MRLFSRTSLLTRESQNIGFILLSILALSQLGCLQFKKISKDGQNQELVNAKIVYIDNDIFAETAEIASFIGYAMQNEDIHSRQPDWIWAMSHCNCAPNIKAQDLKLSASLPGALPEVITPVIREEISSNTALKALDAISGEGLLGQLIGGVTSIFTSNSKLHDSVIKGLDDKLSNALRNTRKLKNIIGDYNFDFFSEFPAKSNAPAAQQRPTLLNISNQAAKWSYILSIDNMWKNTTPLFQGTHHLQLLHTARTLSEWTYLFGIDEPIDNVKFGGLATNPKNFQSNTFGAFDSRNSSDNSGILTGIFQINFPNMNSIQLVKEVKEQWSKQQTQIALEEQAMVWYAAGLAYDRLRPSNRVGLVNDLFRDKDGMFPDIAHLVALNFLPGIADMLDGILLDKNALILLESTQSKTYEASLSATSKLGLAMTQWMKALDKLEQDRLDPNIMTEINNGKNSIKDAVRLSVQRILDNYVQPIVVQSPLGGIAMVRSTKDFTAPSIKHAAEALYFLAKADQQIFKSQSNLYTEKVAGLFHWFIAEYFSNENKNSEFKDLIWTYVALQQFAEYPASIHKAPWLDPILKQLKTSIDNWGGQQ